MESKKMGRPVEYTQETADLICAKLSQGLSLRSICKEEWAPDAEIVFRWLRKDANFVEQYARAKEQGADAMMEDLQELGEEAKALAQSVDPKISNAIVSAVKLQADNMKWAMSKMKPKKYGDKIDLTSGGEKLPTPIYGGNANKV